MHIPNVFQNLVFGKAGASDLLLPKQTMCKHMVDAGGSKDEDASAAKNQILKYVGYIHKQHEESVFDRVSFASNFPFSLAPCLWAMVARSEQKI